MNCPNCKSTNIVSAIKDNKASLINWIDATHLCKSCGTFFKLTQEEKELPIEPLPLGKVP